MARKFKDSQVNFSGLLGQLNTAGIQQENPALYQVLQKLISGASQLQDGLSSGNVSGPSSSVLGNIPVFGGTNGKELIDSGVPLTVLRTETILTNDQLKITTAPYPIIVPNPNPKYMIIPYMIIAFSKLYGAYANINADARVEIGDTVDWSNLLINGNGSAFTDLTDFLINDQKYAIFREFTHADETNGLGNAVAISTPFPGAPLRWKLDNNGAGNLTDGDPLNSVKVVTYYSLEAPL